jgi:hypothetical protein
LATAVARDRCVRRRVLVVRDDPARPSAVIRYLPDRPSGGRYRVVRWAPRSEDRRLFEYLPTLERADLAVTFVEREPRGRTAPLTSERPADWERFERWSQASDRLVRDCGPAWVIRERLVLWRSLGSEGDEGLRVSGFAGGASSDGSDGHVQAGGNVESDDRRFWRSGTARQSGPVPSAENVMQLTRAPVRRNRSD